MSILIQLSLIDLQVFLLCLDNSVSISFVFDRIMAADKTVKSSPSR